eukprot:353237-Chlamydomonas_euryale.AAC.2
MWVAGSELGEGVWGGEAGGEGCRLSYKSAGVDGICQAEEHREGGGGQTRERTDSWLANTKIDEQRVDETNGARGVDLRAWARVDHSDVLYTARPA